MKMEVQLQELEMENEQLKKDREEMLKIISQMRITMNRLIDRYIMLQEKEWWKRREPPYAARYTAAVEQD